MKTNADYSESEDPLVEIPHLVSQRRCSNRSQHL